MKIISNTAFGGERPLFELHDLRMENVVIRAGESAIKECSNIEAVDCRFEGNHPFWHVHGLLSTVVFSMSAGVRHCGIPTI